MERLKHMKESLMACVEGQMGNLQNVDTEELGQAIDMIKDLEEAIYYCSITKAMEKSEQEEKKVERHYYTPYFMPQQTFPWEMDRDYDIDMGRMYYPQGRDSQGRFTNSNGTNRAGGRSRNYGGGGSNGGSAYYEEMEYYGGPSGNYARGGGSYGSSSGSGSSSSGSSGSRYFTEREFPVEWRDTREGRSPMSRKTYMESKEMHKDKASKIKDLENYMKELSEDIVEMIEDASPEEKQLLEKKVSSLATKVSSLNSNAKD